MFGRSQGRPKRSVFSMATSERAAQKDRPPLFFEAGIKVGGGAVAPIVARLGRRRR